MSRALVPTPNLKGSQMTTQEARYALDHWREYPPETVTWAREIVEAYDRQTGGRP